MHAPTAAPTREEKSSRSIRLPEPPVGASSSFESLREVLSLGAGNADICIIAVSGETNRDGHDLFTDGKEQWEVLRKIPLGRSGLAGEYQPAVAFPASEKAGYVAGPILRINGGPYI
jgi:NAD(P)-dependent dehydrogenase (short-subunit alcohol dehydrogenase family)